jgi:hypothetical protein
MVAQGRLACGRVTTPDERSGHGRPSVAGPHTAFVGQVALVLGAFVAYLAVRAITKSDRLTAVAHGTDVLHFERVLGVDWEQGAQEVVVDHHPWRAFFDAYYVWAFWPGVVITLAVLWLRDQHGYRLLRDALFISGAIGLVIFALYPVAPPRMLDGFTDTVSQISREHFVARPSGLVNEYAALPSFHAGWFALATTMIGARLHHWYGRLFFYVNALLMSVAVVITANHYVVDVLVGAGLSFLGLAIASRLHHAGGTGASPSGLVLRPALELDEGELQL